MSHLDGPPIVESVEALLARLTRMLGRTPPATAPPLTAIVGVTGPPGAGKSTLVEGLLARLRDAPPAGTEGEWIGHLPMDGFHLADVQLQRLGVRDRKGAPDTFDVDGYREMLARLRSPMRRTVFAPGFERDLEQPIAAALAIEPTARVVLTEGNYLLLDSGGWEQVRSLLAEVWYVEIDPAVRIDRLVRRHVAFGKTLDEAREWVARSDEHNAALVAATRSKCDLVVRIPGPGAPV